MICCTRLATSFGTVGRVRVASFNVFLTCLVAISTRSARGHRLSPFAHWKLIRDPEYLYLFLSMISLSIHSSAVAPL